MIPGDQLAVLATQLFEVPLGSIEVALDAINVRSKRRNVRLVGLGRERRLHVAQFLRVVLAALLDLAACRSELTLSDLQFVSDHIQLSLQFSVGVFRLSEPLAQTVLACLHDLLLSRLTGQRLLGLPRVIAGIPSHADTRDRENRQPGNSDPYPTRRTLCHMVIVLSFQHRRDLLFDLPRAGMKCKCRAKGLGRGVSWLSCCM
jgi:hypothetical protein